MACEKVLTKVMTLRILAVASLVILSACASREPRPEYAPATTENPFGYQEEYLGEGVYVVGFQAKKDMPLMDVEGYALRRASELAVAEGMAGFDLQERDCGPSTAVVSVPDYQAGQKQVTLNSAVGPVSIPSQDPLFPGYTREMQSQSCLLKIRLLPAL